MEQIRERHRCCRERGKHGRSIPYVQLKVLEGVVCFWTAFPELPSGANRGGQVGSEACCASVKTEVLRAAGEEVCVCDLFVFVWGPGRWPKTTFCEYRVACALGRPHGNQTVKKSKLTTKDRRWTRHFRWVLLINFDLHNVIYNPWHAALQIGRLNGLFGPQQHS